MQAKTGTIYVTTPVAGARIYVDGKITGQATPANVVLGEGQHEIGVEAGGAMQKETVTVKDGDLKKLPF